MNNFNENAAQQQGGQNSQSLIPLHAHLKGRELSSTPRLVNKSKYLNKGIATQELVKPDSDTKNIIVLDGYKCVVCESATIMHMHMISCMKNHKPLGSYNISQRGAIPSTQRQICGSSNASEMAIVESMALTPSMAVVPSMEIQPRLCCAHCNLEFDNEQQVLKHGHIVQFKSKHRIIE